jgi:hypothetical protein
VTVLEFPIWFSHVVMSDGLGITLLFARNGLLVVATLLAALDLWQATIPRRVPLPAPDQPTRTKEPMGS